MWFEQVIFFLAAFALTLTNIAGELKLDLLIARIMKATAELLNADRSTLFTNEHIECKAQYPAPRSSPPPGRS